MMAYSHSANSWLDWSWTHLDQGTIEERSKEKLYTGGQNVIEKYGISAKEIALNSLVWLFLSAILAGVISWKVSPWVWLPWGLIVPMTFWYSQAKKYWHPEIPLCVGFVTCATWLGMAAAGRPHFVLGAIASIPLFLIWAACEQIDQAHDYEPNWPKGGRSVGMWVRHKGILMAYLVSTMMVLTYLSQVIVINTGYLSKWTFVSAVGMIPLAICCALIDKDMKKGVIWGLLGVCLFQVALVVAQAVAK
jgi:hypothetical protein